ncbi:uncharacterized protein BDZ99DRAFT_525110 [Mytilinidion resinicola]|uniref:ADP-ribosylation factor n=1 Tax=Mytilinidion resinicola TaxID=574789 RepID=A0A6A6Y9T4_9PEZI|nr:uncharacterized protein BDZ99DRAFT_525110 [Mytilinidion resinicola]KAF2804754.1 hypothetical protein BDZ99DRAFT_525110 [Mytilinidion resinicola]
MAGTRFPPSSKEAPLPEYYLDLCDEDIARGIRNFDDDGNFEQFDREVRNPHSRIFLVDFGDHEAWCGFDLEATSITRLLNAPRPPVLNTRWINIWLPYDQKEVLHALAKHYDFSPRLLALMCSDPIQPKSKPLSSRKSSSSLWSRKSHRRGGSQKSSKQESLDSEESIGMSEMMQSTQMDLVRDMSHYHIVNEVWHWSSVDWGRRFVCLGYNSLHNVRTNPTDRVEDPDRSHDVPHGKRVWNWLVLCEDKTVISIAEDPFPFSNGNLRAHELRTLFAIRRNLINVFRQLSKSECASRDSSIITLPIRKRIGDSEEETAHRPTDSPGLLFYYLFEDWYTTYSLVARKEHQYAAELDKLRQDMLVKAELSHVDRLHHIGRQLAVLKRVYESYELIIERVLKQPEPTLASLKNSHIVSGADSLASSIPHFSSANQIAEADSLLGVSLSSAARVRFERLRDRIKLYALSEIRECLDQKDSLVMMNFNLIAIKESFAVERLTRTTLLLAKVTILFIPISLLTAYFSTELEGVAFSLKSYWVSFAVTLALSAVALMIFSFASGTTEGKLVYRPLTRIFFDMSKSFLIHRRRKQL